MSLILSIIIILLYGFLAIRISSLGLLLLTITTLLVSFTGIELLKRWLQTMMKLIPFLIIYLIFGYAFGINYPLLIQGILRISYLILLSVFMIRNSEVYIAGCRSNNSSDYNQVKAFFLSTLAFVPIFLQEFRQAGSFPGNLSQKIKLAINNSSNKIIHLSNEDAGDMISAVPKHKHKALKTLIPMLMLGLALILYQFGLIKL